MRSSARNIDYVSSFLQDCAAIARQALIWEEHVTQLGRGMAADIAEQPGGFARLLDYIQKHDKVWFARGDEIAHHWMSRFPAPDYSAPK